MAPPHSRRSRPVVVALVVAVAALAGPAGCSGGGGPSPAPGAARVVRLVDGDTLVARIGGRSERVRLIGIDTPETKDPRKPVQCFGHEASARLAALLPPGTAIRVERDVEVRDRYGRLLLYVWRAGDRLFVNLSMAEDGFAAQLTIPPNVAHADEIGAAVRRARAAGRGLWGACGGPGRPAEGGG